MDVTQGNPLVVLQGGVGTPISTTDTANEGKDKGSDKDGNGSAMVVEGEKEGSGGTVDDSEAEAHRQVTTLSLNIHIHPRMPFWPFYPPFIPSHATLTLYHSYILSHTLTLLTTMYSL